MTTTAVTAGSAGADPATPRSAGSGPATPRSAGSGPTTPRSAGSGPATPRSAGSGPATPRSAGSDPTTPRSAGSDPTTPPKAGACTPAQRVTKSLLGYGVLAGVVFEASVLIQGLTRRGFRIAHDDASLLSNGPLGWIQITTFVLAGAMTIAAAVGVRRATASRWAPRLIAIYGAGLIGAGIFSADPANGFGPGAPLGRAAHISWHGAGHLIAAGIGFAALIAACFVFARYFYRQGRRGLARYSLLTGIVFGAAFAGVATGSASAAVVLPFYAAVLAAFTWLAVVSVHLYRQVPTAA